MQMKNSSGSSWRHSTAVPVDNCTTTVPFFSPCPKILLHDSFSRFFPRFFQDFIGFHWISLDFIGFHAILKDSRGFSETVGDSLLYSMIFKILLGFFQDVIGFLRILGDFQRSLGIVCYLEAFFMIL